MSNSAGYQRVQRRSLNRAQFLALTTLAQAALLATANAQTTPSSDTVQQIEVTGTAIKRLATSVVSGALGTRSELETPFSLRVVSIEEIQSRQAQSIDEVLKLDASVRQAGSGTLGILSLVTVRGMLVDLFNGYKVDGLTYPNRTSLPIEHMEQVELMKGLSGFMYGFGAPGGIVNHVSKKPTDDPLLSVALGYTQKSIARLHVDAGGRLGDKSSLGYRFNAVAEKGDTFVDGGDLKRNSLSLALDKQLAPGLKWTGDALYQKRRAGGVIFGAYLPTTVATRIATPAPISGSTRLGEDQSYYESETTLATTGLQWGFAPGWKASVDYRYAKQATNFREGNVNITNAAGNYNLTQFTQIQDYIYNQVQTMLQGRLDTAGIKHQLVFGALMQELEQQNDRGSNTTTIPGPGNIYMPVLLPATGLSVAGHTLYKFSTIEQSSVFASDTLDISDRWSVLAGLRYTRYVQDSFNAIGAKTLSYSKDATTPTLALTFKPDAETALYASYVESLEKGGTAGVSTLNANEVMGPLKSRQYEVGYKTDRRLWSATAALFRIERGAEYTNAANYFVQDGISQYEGLELGATLRPTRDLTIGSTFMYLDAKYKEAAAGIQGNQIPAASHTQAAIQGEYRVASVPGLRFNGNINYIGKAMLQATNLNEIPAATTIDLSASYRTQIAGRGAMFFVALRNVADRKHWTIYNSGTPALQPGLPRTLSLSAQFDF